MKWRILQKEAIRKSIKEFNDHSFFPPDLEITNLSSKPNENLKNIKIYSSNDQQKIIDLQSNKFSSNSNENPILLHGNFHHITHIGSIYNRYNRTSKKKK